MDQQRRDALRISTVLGLAVAAGLMTSQQASAATPWNSAAFDAKNLNGALKALGGSNAEISKDLIINAPDIAENGAVVQVSVATSLSNVQQLAILVEKNPNTLAADFHIPAGTEPAVTSRIKMAQTSNVHVLAKVDDKWIIATKEIKITLGGCGG